MKCYVINLDRANERLTHMSRELSSLGLEFERFAAIDGLSLSSEDRALVPKRMRSRDWAPGEIGCLLSHYQVWSRVADGADELATIFEDDMFLDHRAGSLLAEIKENGPSADLIKLDTNVHRVEWDRAAQINLGPSRLHRLRSLHCGAGAYVVSRETARQLVRRISMFDMPVDDVLFGRHPASRGLVVLQAVPAVAQQAVIAMQPAPGSAFESAIEPERSRIATDALARHAATRRIKLFGIGRAAFKVIRTARMMALLSFRKFGKVPATDALFKRLQVTATTGLIG